MEIIAASGVAVGIDAGGFQSQRHSIDADCETDSRNRRTAHRLDQPVVSPARDDCALRTETARHHLERGARVVVEASHHPRIDDVLNVRRSE